jgi:2-polyprenyl-6-methoxyphenol hydroxylase-like FAD-dependent oxidoreductase
MHACRFESYEEDSEGVTVHFQGGMPGAVRAKVLVGADGYFSGVRQQCLDDGPPNFGVCCSLCHCKHWLFTQAQDLWQGDWHAWRVLGKNG